MTETISSADIPALVGRDLPASAWREISQARIQRFADATDDHQFIHLDPERAAATPFGGTIAHGYLTLSLLPSMMAETVPRLEGLVMSINYGSDKVRFLQPVPSGARVRLRQQVLSAEEKRPGQWLVKTAATVEIEDFEKPAMVAEILSMWVIK